MKQQFEDHVNWVNETFPDHTEEGHFYKLVEEVDELASTIGMATKRKGAELVDIILVCFSYAAKAGISYNELEYMIKEKIKINRARKWEKQPDGTYQHIR